MNGFVHLHNHTEYSLLDGACRIKQMISYAKMLSQNAVAITDHGVMNGVIDFYCECNVAGIKPVIGCEVYVAPSSRFEKNGRQDMSSDHLVLLCENNCGYDNLIKLVSLGFIEGFYSKPRVDKELLSKYSDGLIALSACISGEIPRKLIDSDYDGAKKATSEYIDIFGRNNFFLELQNHGLEQEKKCIQDLIRLSKELDVGLVATNDCHYIEKSDSEMQKALLCIQTGKTLDEENGMAFTKDEFYMKSTEEMTTLFSFVPEAVSNTVKIAERCNVSFKFGEYKLPDFKNGTSLDNTEYFICECRNGLKKRYSVVTEELNARLDYEIEIVKNMGFVDYYLIVADYVSYAKTHGIAVGPGRGSGAGSLAAYCLGITEIDPIKYGLLFERFLNPERISMPDFDVDFCDEQREDIIRYVTEKYGAENVSQIATFGTFAARAAIRDVGRVLGLPYKKVDMIAKTVPRELNITIKDALEKSADLRALEEEDFSVKRLLSLAKKIEGMPKNFSTHAAGIVITDSTHRVMDYVPLQLSEGAVVTQYPMTVLEKIGLVKMDFLGLRTLSVTSGCEKTIRQAEPSFCLSEIPTDDRETFEMLSRGESVGVFQLESGGMRRFLQNLKPRCLEDIIAATSLYRPGPMDSIDKYVEGKNHPDKITYKHPMLESILKETAGCIIYQEQVMRIFRELAGYSLGRADLVRRAMSKKKHDVMKREREVFINGNDEIEGAVRRGIPTQTADSIFSEVEKFASYAFNKSHAAAYGYLAYQTAYLKCRYKTEYMASLLTSLLDNTDKIVMYIGECTRCGIHVLPPDINESGMDFTPSGKNEIRFGLLAIKNVGQGFIGSVISKRESGGRFKSLYDFILRCFGQDMNRRMLESLIKCGAFDSFEFSRAKMLKCYPEMLEIAGEIKRQTEGGQLNLFTDYDALSPYEPGPDLPEFQNSTLLEMEKETLGFFISGHPVQEYNAVREYCKCDKICNIIPDDGDYVDGQPVKVIGLVESIMRKVTKKNETMAVIDFEDETGSIGVLVFPRHYIKYSMFLDKGKIVMLSGRLSRSEEEKVKIICDTVSQIPADAGKHKTGQTKEKKLFLRIESRNSEKFKRALTILSENSGKTPVYIRFVDTNQLVLVPKTYYVRDCVEAEKKLAIFLGTENVKFMRDLSMK